MNSFLAESPDVELQLTRGHYAALRGYLQGLPLQVIERLYLRPHDGEEPGDLRLVSRQLLAVRDALAQRAHQHHHPEFAAALLADLRHSETAVKRALWAVTQLEGLGTPRPSPSHAVELWFAPALARRLRAAGQGSVGALVDCCNRRGRGWWRRMPRVGGLAATAIVRWLQAHETSLGVALGSHVTGDRQALALASAHQTVTIDVGAERLAPLEALRPSDALNGMHGRNRGVRERCTLAADTDYDAILTWLSLRLPGSHTWRAYRKEAERFLLWAIVERGTAFSSLRVEDCVAYRDFLADPQPRERWCGPMVARFSPAWRPFQGKLCASSQKHALVILRTLCEWLMRQHYLDSNPWDGVPERAPTDPRIQIEKALPMDLWQRFWGWLEDESSAEAGSQVRVARAAVALLRDSGVRLSEACSARREKLRPADDTAGGLWELTIVGKRNKLRTIPVSPRTIEALRAHWRDRGGDFDGEGEGALLGPVVLPATPAALAKSEAGNRTYSASGLHGLLTTAAQRFAKQMSGDEPSLAGRARAIRAHALRHTFGVHSTEADIALDVTQQILGHTSMATTTIYVQGDRKRRLKEIGKLYREGQPPSG